MRKIRENLRTYSGQASMLTLTVLGEAAGLVWDREVCVHPAGEGCDGKRKGCKVVKGAAEFWNERSRTYCRTVAPKPRLTTVQM